MLEKTPREVPRPSFVSAGGKISLLLGGTNCTAFKVAVGPLRLDNPRITKSVFLNPLKV